MYSSWLSALGVCAGGVGATSAASGATIVFVLGGTLVSFKPAQITSLERVASRRNVMRGAAWTTAAVTVVVATPNIAAASTTGPVEPAVTITPDLPTKYSVNDTKYVEWDIDVQCTNMALTGLVLQLTYNQSGGGRNARLDEVVVRNYDPAGDWSASVTKATMTATASATCLTGSVPQGTTAHLHIQFRGSDNSAGEVSATLLANNAAGQQVVIGAVPLTRWGSDPRQHAHS